MTTPIRRKSIFSYWVAGTKNTRPFEKVFIKHIYNHKDGGWRNEKKSNCSTDTLKVPWQAIPDLIKNLSEMYYEKCNASPVEIVDGKVSIVKDAGEPKEAMSEIEALMRETGFQK